MRFCPLSKIVHDDPGDSDSHDNPDDHDDQDDHDDAECTIRYDRVEEAVIPFQNVFVDNPQQDTDKEFLEDIRYTGSPAQVEKVPSVSAPSK